MEERACHTAADDQLLDPQAAQYVRDVCGDEDRAAALRDQDVIVTRPDLLQHLITALSE